MRRPPLDSETLQELIWSFAAHRVLTTAARAGMLRRLATADATAEQIATELQLDPLATSKLLRSLTALGVIELEDQAYRVVETLAPQFRPGLDDLTPFLSHSHRMYDLWGETLEGWLRGKDWPVRRRSQEEIAAFGAAMQASGLPVARQVAVSVDLSRVRRLLDVGGGFGHYARVLAEAEPGLRATVLDIPEVVEEGRLAMASSPAADRVTFVAGDYIEPYPGAPYDLVLMASILHQERGERAAKMVQLGAEALAPGGRLAVVDFSIDEDQHGDVMGALFAVNMRSFGDTHPESVIRGWMGAAGLIEIQRMDLSVHRWMIVGHRPR